PAGTPSVGFQGAADAEPHHPEHGGPGGTWPSSREGGPRLAARRAAAGHRGPAGARRRAPAAHARHGRSRTGSALWKETVIMATATLAGVPREEIGTILSILRYARGWSQEELGRSSGIRSTSIADYERGHTVPTVKKVVRLVAAMGYPLAALDHTCAYLET